MGRGERAEWIGSVGWDGDPGNFPEIIEATDETVYRAAVKEAIRKDEGTLPEQGWPWPWNTSANSDYAAAFDGGKVWASCFGREWFDPQKEVLDANGEVMDPIELGGGKRVAVFPNMKEKKNVAPLGSSRSGTVLFGPGPKDE